MSFKDNIELIGINESELISRAEFSVIEINMEERYIILHGFNEELTEDHEDGKKEEFLSKLILDETGNKLLYIYDYKNSKVQSEWHR